MRKVHLVGKYGGTALVDDEDYSSLADYEWHQTESGYAVRSTHTRVIFMHAVIVGDYDRSLYEVDHHDRNKLNNQRSNLRLVSKSVNQHNSKVRVDNTTGYRGVTPWGNKWRARIQLNGKRVYLGLFKTPEQAALAIETERTKYVAPR